MTYHISVGIPSRNRPIELATTIGALSQQQVINEIVVIDNSDKPYLDNPIFVTLQDMFSREGKSLVFVRRNRRESVAVLKYHAANHCVRNELVLLWDDDSIPMMSMDNIIVRFSESQACVLGFCFLDVVNYLGYSDYDDRADPDNLPEIIHPVTMLYRWFDRNKEWYKIESPWGVGGLFLVNREDWLSHFYDHGFELLENKGVDFVPPEVVINCSYLNWCEEKGLFEPNKALGVIYLTDRVCNLYHPSQPREWDLSKFDETMKYLEKRYIGNRRAAFVANDQTRKEF